VAKHTGHLHLLLQLPCENASSQYDDALSPLSPDMLHEVKTKRLVGNALYFSSDTSSRRHYGVLRFAVDL